MRVRWAGPLRGALPLPAPSRNRGSVPGPAPQSPEGLGGGAPSRAPLLNRRRGWVVGLRPGPRSSIAGGAGWWGSAPGPAPQSPEGLGGGGSAPGFGKGRGGNKQGPGRKLLVRPGPRRSAGYRSVLRRRNVRDRPSSSNGVPYVASASPSA
ncbi:hypothetical protein E6R18_03255 [Streptomyces sp. A1277]|nr:hypothetical protein E6R18_03255 [Streptomyces sp. A1277]